MTAYPTPVQLTLTDTPSVEYHTSFQQDRPTYAWLYAVVAVLTERLQQISAAA